VLLGVGALWGAGTVLRDLPLGRDERCHRTEKGQGRRTRTERPRAYSLQLGRSTVELAIDPGRGRPAWARRLSLGLAEGVRRC
jgi:hypothetical protein